MPDPIASNVDPHNAGGTRRGAQAALALEMPVTGPDCRTRYARSLADGPHDAACLAGFLQAALGLGLAAVR